MPACARAPPHRGRRIRSRRCRPQPDARSGGDDRHPVRPHVPAAAQQRGALPGSVEGQQVVPASQRSGAVEKIQLLGCAVVPAHQDHGRTTSRCPARQPQVPRSDPFVRDLDRFGPPRHQARRRAKRLGLRAVAGDQPWIRQRSHEHHARGPVLARSAQERGARRLQPTVLLGTARVQRGQRPANLNGTVVLELSSQCSVSYIPPDRRRGSRRQVLSESTGGPEARWVWWHEPPDRKGRFRPHRDERSGRRPAQSSMRARAHATASSAIPNADRRSSVTGDRAP